MVAYLSVKFALAVAMEVLNHNIRYCMANWRTDDDSGWVPAAMSPQDLWSFINSRTLKWITPCNIAHIASLTLLCAQIYYLHSSNEPHIYDDAISTNCNVHSFRICWILQIPCPALPCRMQQRQWGKIPPIRVVLEVSVRWIPDHIYDLSRMLCDSIYLGHKRWRRGRTVYLVCLSQGDVHDIRQQAVGPAVENVHEDPHHQPYPDPHPRATP